MRGSRNVVVALAALVTLVGCEETQAYVECTPTGVGYSCVVTHRQGNAANVCWTLNIHCKNGTKASVMKCQSVQPGGKVSTFIPVADISNADKCDMATQVAVEDMRLTEL